MWQNLALGAAAAMAACMIVQALRCPAIVRRAYDRVANYDAKTAALSYGNMTYVDSGGAGEVVLSVHGIFGGYDQAFDLAAGLAGGHRIVAPSRFGYLGSDVLGAGTPAEQATAYAELLDMLGVDQAYVLATSAGGSAGIRFALDYPERTKGLILCSSAMPCARQPAKCPEYAVPPAFLCSDYAMLCLSPLIGPLMGMDSETMQTIFPCKERKEGVVLDASISNPDMARNFDAYHVEDLKPPVLVLQAKDDRLAQYGDAVEALARFPDCTFVSFETGGHLLRGHEQEARAAVADFMGRV